MAYSWCLALGFRQDYVKKISGGRHRRNCLESTARHDEENLIGHVIQLLLDVSTTIYRCTMLLDIKC